jgi:hypothetical protein
MNTTPKYKTVTEYRLEVRRPRLYFAPQSAPAPKAESVSESPQFPLAA